MNEEALAERIDWNRYHEDRKWRRKVTDAREMSDQEIVDHAIEHNPDCEYGVVMNGLNSSFQLTRVVFLYRNEECYLHDDPPRKRVSYPAGAR